MRFGVMQRRLIASQEMLVLAEFYSRFVFHELVYKIQLQRLLDKACRIFRTKFCIQVLPVPFNGSFTDEKLLPDLACRQFLADQREDLLFSRTQFDDR